MTYKSEREEDENNYALSKKKQIAKSHRSNVKISQIFVLDKVPFFVFAIFSLKPKNRYCKHTL